MCAFKLDVSLCITFGQRIEARAFGQVAIRQRSCGEAHTWACRDDVFVLAQLRFKFLQSFILDKDMTAIEVEAFYEEPFDFIHDTSSMILFHVSWNNLCINAMLSLRLDTTSNKSKYISKPLSELRRMFTSPAEVKFLAEQVVASWALIRSVLASFA